MTPLGLDLQLAAPLWVVFLGAAAVLCLTVAGGPHRPMPSSGTHLAVIALAVLAGAGYVLAQYTGPATAFSGALQSDGLTQVLAPVVLGGAFLAVLLAKAYLREHQLARGEFLALLLLATVGMLSVVMAGDLLVLFLGIEIMSLAVYVMAGFRRGLRRAQEAAMKYFVFGAFASGFVVYGIALLYGEVGMRLAGMPDIAFAALRRAFATGEVGAMGWIGVAMVLAGLGFKAAAVPFHMWAPDVYEGAPTPATAFMAVGIKAAAFAGICRFVGCTLAVAPGAGHGAASVLPVLAMLSAVLGNVLALRQQQIKRLLAYSSIAHAGYMLLGVAAFVADPTGPALAALGYYLCGYTAMTLGAFGVVLAFERHEDKRVSLSVDRLAGAARRTPSLGVAMAVFMLALSGIPPTVGFFGKLTLFAAALAAQQTVAVVVAVLASAVGAMAYLRVLVAMFMAQPAVEERSIASGWLTAGLILCGGVTLALGVQPELYLGYARRALAGWSG